MIDSNIKRHKELLCLKLSEYGINSDNYTKENAIAVINKLWGYGS